MEENEIKYDAIEGSEKGVRGVRDEGMDLQREGRREGTRDEELE